MRVEGALRGDFLKISKNDPESEIAKHFNSAHHMGLDDVSIHIVDFVYAAPHTTKSKYLRDMGLKLWISYDPNTLCCVYPPGTDLATSIFFFQLYLVPGRPLKAFYVY